MTRSERRAVERRARCRRKRGYPTWDEARLAALDLWRSGNASNEPNMPTPYPCDQPGSRHYHIGHLRFGART